MNFDPDKVAQTLRERGDTWAETDSAYRALDDATKSILSKIAGESEGSEAAKERSARASDAYLDHLQAVSNARKAAAQARVAYDVYRVWIDMKRSELSYTKAEMQIR